ncbi:Transposon Tf2-9 polyprotein [Frankliniella fusca]|uniref:Transposon Tf2-9 polyprotein n=1 Tax=Frankliniella fusca TaxID=407009 RepID=A0AAE1GTV2_9NEOP|nr:Transposon Tf2-9 polyprotein [Frankliniella fusca]KAK3915833.1 Transposon Tf2-9 polyprotein [Frankliniella fusca]
MKGDEVPEFGERKKENKKLSDIYSDVVRRLHEAYKKNEKYYNLRRREKTFRIGQTVYYANKMSQSDKAKFYAKKLAPRYLGPCTVERREGTSGYVLRNAKGVEIGPYHVQDLIAVEEYRKRD